MGTTLTKPVLLDETGQEIVDKLDEIKTAIGGTGEFIPVMIKVTTPPNKIAYATGDTLDLTGMIVELFGSNGARFDVTEQCTFSPANGTTLTNQDTSVAISYEWYKDQSIFTASQGLTIKALVSIAITTPPTVTEYDAGDALDLTGMVVTATFDDNSTSDVTSQCTYSPANGAVLGATDTSITASLTLSGITKTATQSITVYAIFGAEWDRTASTLLNRTDAAANFTDPVASINNLAGSSPFDNIYPWAGMQIVEDLDLGKIVSIPKFYFKWTIETNKIKLQISTKKYDGFSTSPAHSDRGDGQGERDVVYVGRYKCNSSFKSEANGESPVSNKSLAQCRTGITALKSGAYVSDFLMFWTIRMLMLVEIADWHMVDFFGFMNKSNSNRSMGQTDGMQYHTGKAAETKTSAGSTQYRYIEDLANIKYEWLDGLWSQYSNYYIAKDPRSPRSGNSVLSTFGRSGHSGYIENFDQATANGYEFALFPSCPDQSASKRTYCCSYCSFSDSNNAFVSGSLYNNVSLLEDGESPIFNLYQYPDTATDATSARLMYLPYNV